MNRSDGSRQSPYRSISFRAMNTLIEAAFPCTEDEARELGFLVEDWFRHTERRFSRFLVDSELSRLNRSSGGAFLVSEAMLEVLMLAEAYRVETNGMFNPMILRALRSAGYDSSFEQMQTGPLKPDSASGGVEQRKSGFSLSIDAPMKAVWLPPGIELDLGGIVKSWAVKRLAGWLEREKRLTAGMINAGGDLTAWGEDPPWEIGIGNPWAEDAGMAVLHLPHGSAATSGKGKRRWHTDRGTMHHLIDPRSMLPGDSDIMQCTVCGEDAVACEIWAKTICLLGTEAGLALFDKRTRGYEALVVTAGKDVFVHAHTQSSKYRWTLP